jgi:hypothetical protein
MQHKKRTNTNPAQKQEYPPNLEFFIFGRPYLRLPRRFHSLSMALFLARFSLASPILLSSPYVITDEKEDVSTHSSNGIEEQIIHIKTTHFGKKLKNLNTETQF